MAKTFFMADTHFGDASIIRYENRPFETVEKMNNELVANWNRVVGDGDTVFFLGDFSNLPMDENKRLLAALKGRKIMIKGNHDQKYTAGEWMDAGFEECSDWPIVLDGFYMLSHEPLYVNINMPYANLYGHVHGNAIYKDYSRQSVCVSAERIGYTPIEFSEIKRLLSL